MKTWRRKTWCITAVMLLGVTCLAESVENEWVTFRGGHALRGIAGGQLPDELGMLWEVKIGEMVTATAVICDGVVYVGSDEDKFYAFKLNNGEKLWEFATGDAVEGAACVFNSVVYFGCGDGKVYALDAKTGQEKWTYKTGDRVAGGVNMVKAKGRPLIVVGSYDSKLHAIDAESGQGVWTYDTDNYVNGTPAVEDGRIVFGGCDGLLHVVSAEDGSAVDEITAGEGAYIAGSVAVDGDRAYFGHYGNQFLCADFKAGELVWIYEVPRTSFFSSPAVTERLAVIGGRDHYVHAVDKLSGEKVWSTRTQGSVDSSPVVCGQRVLVGSNDGRLYMIDVNDGRVVWSYDLGQPITASPAVAGGVVVIGCEDGKVYAFGKRESNEDAGK